MALRILSSFLLALALIAAPLVMPGGAALAQAPAAATHDGHCDGPAPAEERRAPVHIGCAGACAAVAAAPAALAQPALLPLRPPSPASSARLSGIAPESETPPPRPSGEKRI